MFLFTQLISYHGQKNNNYCYLIIIIPITLFVNKKRASYSDFELCHSPNRKYMLCFVKIAVTADISMNFIVFRDVDMNSDISDAV